MRRKHPQILQQHETAAEMWRKAVRRQQHYVKEFTVGGMCELCGYNHILTQQTAEMKQNKMLRSEASVICFLFLPNACHLVMCFNYLKYLYSS